jgi:hypothetical protein
MQMLVFPDLTGRSEQDGPYWLVCLSEEHLACWNNKFLESFVDKARSTSELRK